MKPSVLILGLFAFAALFISGCTQEAPPSNTAAEPNVSANNSISPRVPSNSGSSALSMEDVLKQMEPKCGSLIGGVLDTCVSLNGYQIMGDDFCGKFTDYEIANCKKNPTYASSCESMLASTYPACVSAIAMKHRDESYCNKISERAGENTNLTMQLCRAMVNLSKESDKAKNARSLQDCANLSSHTVTDACISAVAIAQKDGSLCANLSGTWSMNSCYEKYAESARDASWCGKIMEDNSSKAKCISTVAILAKDEQICAGDSPCLLAVRKDYAACSGNSSCILDIALLNKDISGCLMLPQNSSDGVSSWQCVGWVALSANDESMCANAAFKQGWCEYLVEAANF